MQEKKKNNMERENEKAMFDGVVQKVSIFDQNKSFETKIDDLHIAFGCDANFAVGVGVAMTSIILNNPEERINFHIVTDGIEGEDIDRIKRLSEYKNVKIYLYAIDLKVFERLPTSRQWSYAIYYRFLLGKILEKKAKKVLYLDADVLCVGDLQELVQLDMGNAIIIGISDIKKLFAKTIKKLEIKSGKYFNSGVMYIDLEKWNRENISEKAVELLCEHPDRYASWDQDVLNVLLDGRVCYVDKKWDYFYNGDSRDTKKKIPDDVKLIHFTGNKPWYKWTLHLPAMTDYFLYYMKKSPWNDVALLEPRTYKEAHRMSQSYKWRGRYGKAIIWYFRYLLMRTRTKCKI